MLPAGPLFQRRKTSSLSLRHVNPSSAASDVSSQSGAPEPSHSSRSSSRRKVSAVEEKPMAVCCTHKVRRSGFQGFGTVVSLVRLCAYAAAIGALWRWPTTQAGVLLLVAALYLLYLRLVVPMSRRDEMGLEYLNAALDVALFSMVLGLAVAGAGAAEGTVNALGVGMLVVQCTGFASYLVNRMLIIVHAFGEVVCPGCSCAPPAPRGKSSRRRQGSSRRGSMSQRSDSMSMSDGGRPQSFTSEGKPYFLPDGAKGDGPESVAGSDAGSAAEHGYLPPGVVPSPSRSVRSGGPSMFPAIAEETDSQVGTPKAGDGGGVLPTPRGGGEAGPASFPVPPPGGLAPLPDSRPGAKGRGRNDVFEKFWKSL